MQNRQEVNQPQSPASNLVVTDIKPVDTGTRTMSDGTTYQIQSNGAWRRTVVGKRRQKMIDRAKKRQDKKQKEIIEKLSKSNV